MSRRYKGDPLVRRAKIAMKRAARLRRVAERIERAYATPEPFTYLENPVAAHLREASRVNAARADEALAVFHFLLKPDEDSPMIEPSCTCPRCEKVRADYPSAASKAAAAQNATWNDPLRTPKKTRDQVIADERAAAARQSIGPAFAGEPGNVDPDPPEPRYVRARVEFSDTPDFRQTEPNYRAMAAEELAKEHAAKVDKRAAELRDRDLRKLVSPDLSYSFENPFGQPCVYIEGLASATDLRVLADALDRR